MDICCGLGILSLLAIEAGAKHVYAIDKSNIVQLTQRIICENHFSDKITVIRGAAVDVQLPVNKVDIIVSTLFRFVTSIFLSSSSSLLFNKHCIFFHLISFFIFSLSIFHDRTMTELIDARNKWLKIDGLIFPDQYTLNVAAICRTNEPFRWDNVYGFDMSPIRHVADRERYTLIKSLHADQLMSNLYRAKVVNLYKVTKTESEDYSFIFQLETKLNGFLSGIIVFVDIEFTKCHTKLILPKNYFTSEFYLSPVKFHCIFNDLLHLNKNDKFYGIFEYKKHNAKKANVNLKLGFELQREKLMEKFEYDFRLYD